MRTIFALPVMVWLAVFPARGQDAPPAFEKAEGAAAEELDPFDPVTGAIKVIRVQVEHIEMSHKDLTRLMMDDKAVSADATALRMKVQEMVEKDGARVIDTQLVLGKSGQKQTTESRQEFIYPTEYEPPGSEDIAEKLAEIGAFPHNPATPTAFELRNLGSSLESEPTLGADEKTVDLRFLSELKWHTGNSVWNEGKDTRGNAYKVTMPGFYSLITSNQLTCVSGQYSLVGALSPKNSEGKLDIERKVMVFVKCDVLPVIP